MKIDFVIPVYNEDSIFLANAVQIYNFLRSSNFTFEWELVFVVNGSSQEFEEMVKTFSNKYNHEVGEFVVKGKGKGGAIKKYFDKSNADVLAYMDMDLAVSLDDINKLITPVIDDEVDLCFGSRMLPQSSRDRSWFRELNSKLYILLSQVILGHDFSDLQCGFKAINKKAWTSVSLKIKNKSWFFDTELIFYTKKLNYKIKEIPIDWSENRYDNRKSKVNVWRDGAVFLKEIIKLKMQNK